MVWGKNGKSGKPVPLDAKPERRYVRAGTDPQGNAVFQLTFAYMPHHATCPKVAEFRREKGK